MDLHTFEYLFKKNNGDNRYCFCVRCQRLFVLFFPPMTQHKKRYAFIFFVFAPPNVLKKSKWIFWKCVCSTYSVWMLFIESKVPFASVWMLLSYSDSKLKLAKSLNVSFRMHVISFAFNSSNCSELNPRNIFVGKFFILLPYKTLAKFTFFLVEKKR